MTVWLATSITAVLFCAILAGITRDLLDAPDVSDVFSLLGLLAAASLLFCALVYLWRWAT